MPTNQQIDPQAKALVSAIGATETGPSSPDAYTKKGASGEYGRYQFLPATWDEYSKEAGVNTPLEQASIEDQNKVAYTKVKQWKDQGYNPAQIASMWNAGPGKPNAYKENYKGVNAEGVAYDTPAYAQKVSQYYQQFKEQSGGPTQQPQTQDSSSFIPNVGDIGHELGNNIASRFQQGSQAIGMLGTGLASGDLGKSFSGGLQTVGSAAGGIGDVLNAGLQLVPGVQAVEHGITNALGSFAQTDTGKSIVKGMGDFAQAHPEIAGDIGAAVNIASVIPMFKGLSLIKGGVTDAATSALKGNLTEAASNEIRNNLVTKTAQASLDSAERRGLNPLGVLTSDVKNLPAIVETDGGKFVYDGAKAAQNIQTTLSKDEETLQTMLSQGVKKNIGVDLNKARQDMLSDVVKEFPVSAKGGQAIKAVNEFFDNVLPTTGGRNIVDINELNGLKRDIGSGVNWLNLSTKSGEIKSAMYRSLMNQVEGYAEKAGVTGVKELNKTMGEKIEALKILKNITGRTVKQSKFGKVIREVGADIAGGAGELAGSQAGIPFASTLAGRGLYRVAPGRVPLTAVRLLGRDGRGTVKSSLTKGFLKSGMAQGLRGLVQPPQQ